MKEIGKYKIEEELGRGGMGLVYKAFDPPMQRHGAIKERFYCEACACGNRVYNSNITTLMGKKYLESLPGRSSGGVLER